MDKLKMQSLDVAQGNVAKIAALFPHCVTERVGKDGKPELAIDFDKLRSELSEDIFGEGEERYQFTWPDKRAASHLANERTTQTLRPCREESVNFDTTENLYIEGDNLDVLKVLRETYLGKVKMIYIDPPYNTGNDFVYNDDFAQGREEFEAQSGLFDEEGNQTIDPMVRNTESNGRFHTDWLNMIYPRLKVARDLLTDDGVIFISIDGNEYDNLLKVCFEIFGQQNFIGSLVLKTATDNNPSQINTEHEYMLCFGKNKFLLGNWTRQSEAAQLILKTYQSLKGQGLTIDEIQTKLRAWIKSHKDQLPQVAHYNNVDEFGVYSSSSNSSNPHPGGYMFDIIHPITGLPCPKPANGWRWPEKTFKAYDADGQIEWGKDHTTQPHVKKRIESSVEYLRSLIYEDNRASTKLLADLFDGKKIFDNPKPLLVIAKLVEYVCDDNALILDFFSGSATTAHAIIKLNAENGSKRKFIMVQLPEITDEKSEAHKAGYGTICEIGKERIRRAGCKEYKEIESAIEAYENKIREIIGLDKSPNGQATIAYFSQCADEAKKAQVQALEAEVTELSNKLASLDIGFRVLKLDESNMADVYYTPDNFDLSQLDLFEDNVKPGRTNEDLLFQTMLSLGIELSAKIVVKEIAGKQVFSVDDDYLLACFDKDVNETTIEEMSKLLPTHLVIRDASAANDNVLDNFDQIIESYSAEKKITTHIL